MTTASRPRLRGVLHQVAFDVSLVTGTVLVLLASDARSRVAATVYAVSVSLLFGASALYHRVTWRPKLRGVLRRIDHASIFLLIAGTYTPVVLLAAPSRWSAYLLAAVWTVAGAAIALHLSTFDAPRWVSTAVYLALGWLGLAVMPLLWHGLGIAPVILLAIGGVLYSIGAVCYWRRYPDPSPTVFGYHEVFHALVVAAAACHYAAILLIIR